MAVMIMGTGGLQKTAGVECDANNKISVVDLLDVYKIPAVPNEGTYSQTFQVAADLNVTEALLNQGKELLVPDIFTKAELALMSANTMKNSNYYQNGVPGFLETITWDGEGTADISGVWMPRKLTSVNVAHADRIDCSIAVDGSVSNTHAATYASKKVVINANAATYIRLLWPVTSLNTQHVYPELINSGIVNLSTATYPRQFPFYTNTSSGAAIMRFNGAKTVNFDRQTHARGGSFYFPVIESLAASGTNAVYGIHIYLGPNLSTISNATKFSSSNYVTVHIPAGESTTKTTLDTAGVSYTQDYVIS